MKKIKNLLVCGAAALLLASCSFGTVPVGATSNSLGSKVGTSTSTRVLMLFPISDGGVAEAARQGGISKISTVDVKATSYLGIVTTVQTTVTGE